MRCETFVALECLGPRAPDLLEELCALMTRIFAFSGRTETTYVRSSSVNKREALTLIDAIYEIETQYGPDTFVSRFVLNNRDNKVIFIVEEEE